MHVRAVAGWWEKDFLRGGGGIPLCGIFFTRRLRRRKFGDLFYRTRFSRIKFIGISDIYANFGQAAWKAVPARFHAVRQENEAVSIDITMVWP